MKKQIKTFNCLFFSITLCCYSSFALAPNPLISKNKTIKGSSASNLSTLIDGQFTSGGGWAASANSWVAINVGKGYSKVFLCWDSPMQVWSDSIALPHLTNPDASCPKTVNMPFDYKILTSDSSIDGTDGQWTTVDSVKGNVVAGRGHLVDFTGKSWIKMNISRASSNSQIDEISIFDASKGFEDSWIFIGTSISGMAFRSYTPTSFAEIIATKSNSSFTPCMIRGGIGCIRSSDVVQDISKYLANAGNIHFWAIEMGTNDAWGGTNTNVSSFKANLQLIIDSCKVHNIQPIIARMIATKASWQIHPDYLAAIDSLTSQKNLIPGPDFYNYFLQNSSQLSGDGIHPNVTGAAAIQRLWAEKMDTLIYQKTSAIPSLNAKHPSPSHAFSTISRNKSMIFRSKIAGRISLFSPSGEIIDKINTVSPGAYVSTRQCTPGIYVVRFASAKGVETIPVLNR